MVVKVTGDNGLVPDDLSVNPHPMASPKVFTFPITATPDGTAQDMGLAFEGIAILYAVLHTTIPEATGSSKRLRLVTSDSGALMQDYFDVAAESIGTNHPYPTTPLPQTGNLHYKAGSGDWAEFRGTIKVIYIDFADL